MGILLLLLAWQSGLNYSFIGTAKSEYYLRDETGWHRCQSCRDEGWHVLMAALVLLGALARRPNCSSSLRFHAIGSPSNPDYLWTIGYDFGNPMMDLDPSTHRLLDSSNLKRILSYFNASLIPVPQKPIGTGRFYRAFAKFG
jgi:hypothetical protein